MAEIEVSQYVYASLGIWDAQEVVIPAAGTGQVEFAGPKPGQIWLVRKIIVRASTGSPVATVYRGEVKNPNIIAYTECPVDVDDEEPPGIPLVEQKLIVAWTSATVGATHTAIVLYDLVSQLTAPVEEAALVPAASDAQSARKKISRADLRVVWRDYPNQQTRPRFRR